MKKTITLLSLVLLSFVSFSQVGLKINEIDYDQLSTDSAEFLEIYNADVNGIDLSLYSIYMVNGFNGTGYDSFPLPAVTLAPGDFFVLCGNGGYVPNCDMVIPRTSNIIQNGSPDAVAIRENSTGNIIDVVSYEGSTVAPYVEGTGLDSVNSDVYVGAPLRSIGRFPDGADSNNNNADFHIACATAGLSNFGDTTTCATAISSIDHSFNSFSIFPNPTKGFATIECKGLKDATISLRNVLGKEIKSIVLTSQDSNVNVDLTEYPDGVYFVQVKSSTTESTRRIILRK